ncbi:MAG: phosphatase PAP2 family protein [Planctomycetota bacterium]
MNQDRTPGAFKICAGGDARFGLRHWDLVVLAYLVIETVLVLINLERIPFWPVFLLIHALLVAGILLIVRPAAKTRSRTLRIFRDWYPVLYVLAVFKMLNVLVPAISPVTYDDALFAWDRTLFGDFLGARLDPLASPWLTELLRACWLSYFALPFLVAVPLYRRKRKSPYHEAVLALVLGWLISFLGYYVVPAWGPGYFPKIIPAPPSVTGPGVTQSVALTLFALEGRMNDVFPSGHAIIALLALWLALRNGIRGWPLLIPVVLGLLLGTVYLRYHYGVDVIAGVFIALLVMWIAPRWHRAMSPS